jgi:Flp pilus assembly protein TadG
MKTTIRKIGGCCRTGESGQSIVEFAILLPVLLMMLLGLMEWGFVLWTKTTFANAVREGARDAVVIRDWDTNNATRQTEIKSLVVSRLTGLPTSLTKNIANRITITFKPNSTNIQSVTVSIVNQPYTPILGFSWVAVPTSLSSSAEFRFEGGL